MERKKVCCFAGHNKEYSDLIISKIKEKAEELIIKDKVTEFWVGNYGKFDYFSAAIIRKLKESYPDIKLILVIPYLTKAINIQRSLYMEKYDEIIIADAPISTPTKYKIIKANHFMIDNSSHLICFISHTFGGAIKTYNYAKKRNVKIYNISEVK